jgi:hypothetical protein
VAETVDIIVNKNLVRANAVALKDVGKNVVFRVEAKVATEGVDRKDSGRISATRAACVARGV